MNDAVISAASQHAIPEIERVDVSSERLSRFRNEHDYVGLAVELMVEAGSYVTVAASILGPDGAWTRDQAAIGGNMVRLYKLLSAMLDQTVERRRETSFIVARLAFETIVVLRFLLQKNDPALIDSYVKHSLDHERRLLAKVDKRIEARHGIVLPIEDRIRRSVDRLFKSSGVAPGQLTTKREQNWGGKNLFEKAAAVGLGEAYLGMFAGASLNVHGAWSDLYTHHLQTAGDGRFTPQLEWNWPRPPPLYGVALLSLDVVEDFARFMDASDIADYLTPKLDDLRERLMDADQAHESYLTGKSWPQI